MQRFLVNKIVTCKLKLEKLLLFLKSPVNGREMEECMARVFTDYPEGYDTILKSNEGPKTKKHKKIKELQKEVKKQRKVIRELSKQESKDGGGFLFEKGNHEKNQKKTFLTRVGDALLEALPSIFRTTAKIIVTAICEYAINRLRKAQVV